jgi:hypothetical protein
VPALTLKTDLSLALPLNLTSFGLAVGTVVALLIAVTLLYRHPTRHCHHCGRRVRLDQRVCRHCGYDFEPDHPVGGFAIRSRPRAAAHHKSLRASPFAPEYSDLVAAIPTRSSPGAST